MGRLQRKKISPRKKKQNGDTASTVGGSGSANEKALPSAASGDGQKKQVLSHKKSTAVLKNDSYLGRLLGKGIQFLREVKAELRKVTWPSRKQTVGSTIVVIILVMIISFFLGIVDMGLAGLIQRILQ